MSGAVTKREFAAILRSFGRNTIFTLNFGGAATPVKIAEMQLDPVKGSLLHVDLLRISLTEKTEFEVRVETVGEPDGCATSMAFWISRPTRWRFVVCRRTCR